MEGEILVYFTPKSPDLVPSDFRMFSTVKDALKWRSYWRGAKPVKDATKTFFFLTEFKKKTCEMLEPVR
jgi:hypothetical protein